MRDSVRVRRIKAVFFNFFYLRAVPYHEVKAMWEEAKEHWAKLPNVLSDKEGRAPVQPNVIDPAAGALECGS